MARSKAYLFGGVEIRWFCDPSLIKDETPAEAVFHFPGGLKDYLLGDHRRPHARHQRFVLRQRETRRRPRLGRMGRRLDQRRRRLLAILLQHHPDSRRRHPRKRPALGAVEIACANYGERVGNKKATQITADDVMGTAASMLSVFIREPEFQGQTKEKLATQEATRIVENTVKDAFDHWLTDAPQQAQKLLEWCIEQAEDRLKRKREKEVGRQSATRKLRLPGKLADCTIQSPAAPKSSSSKATRPAAPPRGAQSRRRRPSCRCAEKSSTSPTLVREARPEPIDL